MAASSANNDSSNNADTTIRQMNAGNNESAATDLRGRDYKTMAAILKAQTKKADELHDQLSELTVKFGEHMTRLATIIEPEVNAILYKKFPGCPDLSKPLPISKEELESKYSQMCEMLNAKGEQRWKTHQDNQEGRENPRMEIDHN